MIKIHAHIAPHRARAVLGVVLFSCFAAGTISALGDPPAEPSERTKAFEDCAIDLIGAKDFHALDEPFKYANCCGEPGRQDIFALVNFQTIPVESAQLAFTCILESKDPKLLYLALQSLWGDYRHLYEGKKFAPMERLRSCDDPGIRQMAIDMLDHPLDGKTIRRMPIDSPGGYFEPK